jgi:hypothetical protein
MKEFRLKKIFYYRWRRLIEGGSCASKPITSNHSRWKVKLGRVAARKAKHFYLIGYYVNHGKLPPNFQMGDWGICS